MFKLLLGSFVLGFGSWTVVAFQDCEWCSVKEMCFIQLNPDRL